MLNIPDIPPEGLPLPGAPRYVLRKLLGRGGFGDAYLADDEELTRRVVIKLLMNLSDPTIRDRFKREARISANIRHPAVVQVFDIGALPDGRPYFIMEHIDGTSLTQFIQERGATFSLSRSLTLLAEAAEGLAVAHTMGVIHRDIKPDNILVTRDGHAKLIDFGIAKKAVEESSSPTGKQTSIGTVLGTPRYISPEQATAKVLAAASDLYSLGCVMYTLLSGHSPFEGSAHELMMHHVYTPAPTLAASAPGRVFPPAVEGIVARLLAKDPLRRYQTGDELARALRQAAEQARIAEESDATSALPVITEDMAPPAEGRTVSHAHSAPQPVMSSAPAFAPGSPQFAAGFGVSEGGATAALEVAPPRKDESLSSRMPVTVMGDDLTGRTVSTRSKAPLAIAGVLVLLLAAGVGTKMMFFSTAAPTPTPSATTTAAAKATDEESEAPPEKPNPKPTTDEAPSLAPTIITSTTAPIAPTATATTTATTAATSAGTGKAKPPTEKPIGTAKPVVTTTPTVATVAKPSSTATAPATTAAPPPTGTLGAIDDRK